MEGRKRDGGGEVEEYRPDIKKEKMRTTDRHSS